MLVRLCDKSILPEGEMKAFKVKDKDILVINSKGKILCLDGRCTHAGAPLAEGTVEGDMLTCPWHYSQFNIIDGSVIRGPAYKQLRPYRVEEKDNSFYIEL